MLGPLVAAGAPCATALGRVLSGPGQTFLKTLGAFLAKPPTQDLVVAAFNDALRKAERTVQEKLSGVTAGLGVAFNSTLIALLISIVIMFLLHQLQLAQERLVLDSETYLDQHLIRHMQVR
jgi:hypothetical protein